MKDYDSPSVGRYAFVGCLTGFVACCIFAILTVVAIGTLMDRAHSQNSEGFSSVTLFFVYVFLFPGIQVARLFDGSFTSLILGTFLGWGIIGVAGLYVVSFCKRRGWWFTRSNPVPIESESDEPEED